MWPPAEMLPNLWEKPDAELLLGSLRALRVEPTAWSAQPSRADVQETRAAWVTARESHDVVLYLSQLVKSRLSWIDDEAAREHVWAEASRRLAERCGRAGTS